MYLQPCCCHALRSRSLPRHETISIRCDLLVQTWRTVASTSPRSRTYQASQACSTSKPRSARARRRSQSQGHGNFPDNGAAMTCRRPGIVALLDADAVVASRSWTRSKSRAPTAAATALAASIFEAAVAQALMAAAGYRTISPEACSTLADRSRVFCDPRDDAADAFGMQMRELGVETRSGRRRTLRVVRHRRDCYDPTRPVLGWPTRARNLQWRESGADILQAELARSLHHRVIVDPWRRPTMGDCITPRGRSDAGMACKATCRTGAGRLAAAPA